MSALVFRGRGRPAPERTADGARAIFWEDCLSSEEADAIEEAAMAWTKAWGTRPVRDGRSVRDLLTWRGVSLWWFAELYLFHSTDAPRWVRTIEAFHRILEAERPAEVEADGLPPEEAVLLERTCAARGVLFHGHRRPPAGLALRTRRVSLRARWNDVKTVLTAVKTALWGAPAIPRDAAKRTVLFLSHAAFWRRRRGGQTEEAAAYEHYFDALIPGVARHGGLSPVVLAVGPPDAFRRRGPRDRLRDWTRLRPEAGPYVGINRFTTFAVARDARRASGLAREAWRALRGSPGLREAFSHRGVAFDDLAGPDLAGTLLLQLPWAVRSYEEVAEALRALRPAALVLYAESSGWGRAALLALAFLGFSISGFALSTSVWLSCLALFIGGLALIAVFALVNSLVQLITTNEMRGRVMSVYNVAFRGGMPMGNLLTGKLVESYTAPVVLAVNGVVLVGVALYFLMVHRRIAAL